MDTLIGIKGRDCVILAAGGISSSKTLFMRDNQTNIRILSKYCMIGVLGDPNDTSQFCSFLSSHIELYDIQNDYPLGPQAIVNFASNKIVSSRTNTEVAMLLAGYDSVTGSLLSSVNPLGIARNHNYAVQGMNNICDRILDKMWKPDLSYVEAINIVRMCINQIEKFSSVNQRCYNVFVVDKDGARQLENR